jgi:hypothetical protein
MGHYLADRDVPGRGLSHQPGEHPDLRGEQVQEHLAMAVLFRRDLLVAQQDDQAVLALEGEELGQHVRTLLEHLGAASLIQAFAAPRRTPRGHSRITSTR